MANQPFRLRNVPEEFRVEFKDTFPVRIQYWEDYLGSHQLFSIRSSKIIVGEMFNEFANIS